MFHTDALIAVTGAEMTPKIDGIGQRCNVALRIRAGSVLSFHYVKPVRARIAVAGGIDVPVVLGSRSTYTLGAIGGHAGRRLQKATGCRSAPRRHAPRRRELPAAVAGRSTAGRAARADGPATTGSPTNRRAPSSMTNGRSRPKAIGYRYRTAARCSSGRASSHSAQAPTRQAIVVRATRSARSGCRPGTEPIILHRDAVSGSYATIGTVISASLDLIGQMQPNHRARFVRVTISDALAARASTSGSRCCAPCCRTEHRAPRARAGRLTPSRSVPLSCPDRAAVRRAAGCCALFPFLPNRLPARRRGNPADRMCRGRDVVRSFRSSRSTIMANLAQARPTRISTCRRSPFPTTRACRPFR